MASSDLGYTEPVKCWTCGNTGMMKVVCRHTEEETVYPPIQDMGHHFRYSGTLNFVSVPSVSDSFSL